MEQITLSTKISPLWVWLCCSPSRSSREPLFSVGGSEDHPFRGVMRMYIFDLTNPDRDGDLDNGIMAHEYTHGVSNRLTGGPADVSCLSSVEAAGMGEGWSDFVATILRTNAATTRNNDFPIGAYALGNTLGVRHYPYSTSMSTNPTTYSFINHANYHEPHNLGEIWASMLYEAYWNILDCIGHGFQSDWFDTNRPYLFRGGNVIMLQIVIQGMKFQPCNPTLIQARDAILYADLCQNLGANSCPIWRGFAKRGLGFSAGSDGVDKFDVPFPCWLG